jgi:hypothetical protein
MMRRADSEAGGPGSEPTSDNERAHEAGELRAYLAIIRRRLGLIAGTLAITLLVASVGTALLPRVYEATTTVRITTVDETTDRANYDSVMYAGRLVNTYAKIVSSGSVADELAARLGLAEPPKIKVEVPPNTELMQITVEHRGPAVAADGANALVDILIARAGEVSAGWRGPCAPPPPGGRGGRVPPRRARRPRRPPRRRRPRRGTARPRGARSSSRRSATPGWSISSIG